MADALLMALVATVFGAAGGVLVLLYGTRGERSRFEAELVPIRTALDDLDDRIDQWRKRDAKRERDSRAAPGRPQANDQGTLDGFVPISRKDRLEAVRARATGRWGSGRV